MGHSAVIGATLSMLLKKSNNGETREIEKERERGERDGQTDRQTDRKRTD